MLWFIITKCSDLGLFPCMQFNLRNNCCIKGDGRSRRKRSRRRRRSSVLLLKMKDRGGGAAAGLSDVASSHLSFFSDIYWNQWPMYEHWASHHTPWPSFYSVHRVESVFYSSPSTLPRLSSNPPTPPPITHRVQVSQSRRSEEIMNYITANSV